jgi:hypothetical protein
LKRPSVSFPRLLALLWAVNGLLPAPAWAFDPKAVPDGLVYNGTLIPDQLWTPLVLVEGGQLRDPFLEVKQRGLERLRGEGKTSYLKATSAFLMGCPTDASLMAVAPIIATFPTPFVYEFAGYACPDQLESALRTLIAPPSERGNNSFPTYLVAPSRDQPPTWVYGVPGMLTGGLTPVMPRTREELGAQPAPVAGVVSRVHFVPLPVVSINYLRLSAEGKRPLRTFGASLGEVFHRGQELAVSDDLLAKIRPWIETQLKPRYLPRLEAALAGRFGGVARRYVELGLVQGIDVDNSKAYDYVGVIRFGLDTKAGPARWLDVLWCWRSGAGDGPDALRVLRTSEEALYAAENGYFSELNPADVAPTLVVSGFADLDMDKRMEVISALLRPAAQAVPRSGMPGETQTLWLRDSAIHAWEPDGSAAGRWQEVYRTVPHEARMLSMEAKDYRIQWFGRQ